MRVWDISAKKLCKNHLLGEHRELHAIWSIITEQKKGYSLHPETMRWKGKLKALYFRHEELVIELHSRGYRHHSSLDKRKAIGASKQNILIDSIPKQIQILKQKRCSCQI
ncbi:pyrimidine dimer DNA glycosylase [Nitrosopumilus sp. K4]|uniref:pyrimidine dimer DNA glycosylase/endonuclease V n=1 Tax=Nitrosopumilus sp. K4 TaxID=2795383 RepID=UPI001BADBB52|nr:pyrimidine dimer DNA glycosylase/endonuclease V [Nitrosopumilus sp. K4]QUC65221.1 pyrimidine dimer DNA glycosylase [Nitrosopumilus sp. K4]